MATFMQRGNILVVLGSDIHTTPDDDYRLHLRDFLYSDAARRSPVRRGTHNFWVTYAEPSLGGGEHAHEDLRVRPHRMCGMVRMGSVPGDSSAETIKDHIHTVLQEVGHHWLVPADLGMRVDAGRRVPLPNGFSITRSINDETSFAGPPLLGRDDVHWTSYFQADASPMDGMNFIRLAEEDHHSVWQPQAFTGPEVRPSGLAPLNLIGAYNDLDLTIMGVKEAGDAYTSTGGRFRWLEPVLAAPMNYHAGLIVAFSENDFLYFGFYREHRKLRVERTNGVRGGIVDLGAGYHPLAEDYNGMALRVVRRGDQYYFQARYNNSAAGLLSGTRLFDELETLPPPDPTATFDRFRTVEQLTIPNADRPRALGMIVKKWAEQHFMVEAAFHNLEIMVGGTAVVARTDRVPPPMGASYGALSSTELRLHNPLGNAIVRSKGGRLHMLAPYALAPLGGSALVGNLDFDHWTAVDRAPKALLRAPPGDFAFATSAKIHRAIYTPWALGYASDKTVWGHERSARAQNVGVPSRIRDKWPSGHEGTYKTAFIVVAKRSEDVTPDKTNRLDIIRRYWDEAFKAATLEHLQSDSTL
jgi:hypothetical protein